MVAELVYLLGQRTLEDRKVSATFWLVLGRADFALAHECISEALSAWPGCKKEVLEDPVLGRAIFAVYP